MLIVSKLDRPGAPVRRWDLPQMVGGPCRWAGCDTPSSTTEQVAGEVMALCAPHAERERAWKMGALR